MVARIAWCACIAALVSFGAPKPADETRRFPMTDRVSVQVIDQKMLGRNFLPGGNLAEYRHGKKSWQQFLVRGSSPQSAALLLFDFKGTLRDPRYIPYMGGYFGFDGSKPVYVFAKGSFIAGVVGLPEKEADVIARQFAARLD